MTAEVLWSPSPEAVEAAAVTAFGRAAGHDRYDELWRWSVAHPGEFWAQVWHWSGVVGDPGPGPALADAAMPAAVWFPGATLNYVEQVFRAPEDRPALVCCWEGQEPGDHPVVTYGELRDRVAAVARGLAGLGVGRGDRVAAYAPNVAEVVVAFLAVTSLGAVWSCCSPDFGTAAVLDRFAQIGPTVLLAADGYRWKGAVHDRRPVVAELARSLPTLRATVLIDVVGTGPLAGTVPFAGLGTGLGLGGAAALATTPVAFDHPLWVLYSSGTTGRPKALVHGHGGIVLEHLKFLSLHAGLGPDDRFFWFTSTGWMMWNMLVGALLVGATAVLYDGSPTWPDADALWRLAASTGTTWFGTSAPFVEACMRAGTEPARAADLSKVKAVGSTGAPLGPDGFRWVYDHVGPDLLLASLSGGTDVCTAFVGPCPTLPVRAGEVQCRCLGAPVAAFDAAGQPVTGKVGELVLTGPMPSMPLFLWGDTPGADRYRASYYSTFPGVWRHGDWVEVTAAGGVVISGRSDSTLNRGGVRTGTAEIYRVVEAVGGVADSLVVDTGRLWLFVVPADGSPVVSPSLRAEIEDRLRTDLSPRHVPDEVVAVTEVPRTLNGKKLEVPVKRVLMGEPIDAVVTRGAVANPDALGAIAALAAGRRVT